ncbi:MAG: energy transducer TonB [Akkermansia sp.]|nr:energy transducer TonB [Akkermansia sp.]
MMVALPALIVLPLLALSRNNPATPAPEAPLFTMASEPPARAQGKPLLIPAVPIAELPDLYFVPCTLYIPPTPQALQPIACSFEPSPPNDSDLTVTNLPEPRQPRLATNQNRKLSIVNCQSTTPPAYLSAPKPPYPAAMRQRRLQGCVGVRIAVSPLGTPTTVDITQPSGHAEFDSATRSWILRHWRFRPATAAGQAVASTVTTTVRFTLN